MLDPEGWASVAELIKKGSTRMPLSVYQIRHIVETNDKKRFSLSEEGQRIRANQGHSISVDLGPDATEPPETLYHGTATRFLPSIGQDGLKPGKRNHVHLSATVETAIRVGQRHGKPVVLAIASGLMHRDGYAFYVPDNGAWLTAAVPPAFLTIPD